MSRQTQTSHELESKPRDYKPVGFVWASLESRELSITASTGTFLMFSRKQQKACLCSSWKSISSSILEQL